MQTTQWMQIDGKWFGKVLKLEQFHADFSQLSEAPRPNDLE